MIAALFVLAVYWVKLQWTAPGDPQPNGTWAQCASYEAERWDAGANWFPTTLYRDSAGVVPKFPAPPFTPETGWIPVPSSEQEWRNGGMALHIRDRDMAGNVSDWSNRIVGIVGPDTTWYLKRWNGATPYYTQAAAGRSVWFPLTHQDVGYATVAHCEEVNRSERFTICTKFGSTFPGHHHEWTLRGHYYSCLDSVADLRIAR